MFSLRAGTNCLEIERGRHSRLPVLERVCKHCTMGQVENEVHFGVICPKYLGLREELYSSIARVSGGKWNLETFTDVEKFILLVAGTGDQFEQEIFSLFQLFLVKAFRLRG